jgi:hypothetical protein
MDRTGAMADVVAMLFDLTQLVAAGLISVVWVRQLRNAS